MDIYITKLSRIFNIILDYFDNQTEIFVLNKYVYSSFDCNKIKINLSKF